MYCQIFKTFRLFLKIWFIFKLTKTYIPQEVGHMTKNLKKDWKNVSVSEKKFPFDTDTKTGPWFRFPIPKPGFCCTLAAGATYLAGKLLNYSLCVGVYYQRVVYSMSKNGKLTWYSLYLTLGSFTTSGPSFTAT